MKTRIWCLLVLVVLTGCAVGSVSEVSAESDATSEAADGGAPSTATPSGRSVARENVLMPEILPPPAEACAACGPSPQPWQERPAFDPAR